MPKTAKKKSVPVKSRHVAHALHVEQLEPTAIATRHEEEFASWRERALTAERRCSEYVVALESYQQQRDTWNRMYHTQARQHTAAESYLYRQLEKQKMMLASAARLIVIHRTELNKARPENDQLPPFQFKPNEDLEGKPLKLAFEFLDAQRALLLEAQKLFGGPEVSSVVTQFDVPIPEKDVTVTPALAAVGPEVG